VNLFGKTLKRGVPRDPLTDWPLLLRGESFLPLTGESSTQFPSGRCGGGVREDEHQDFVKPPAGSRREEKTRPCIIKSSTGSLRRPPSDVKTVLATWGGWSAC